MLTLGIESSCDETAVAVVDSGREIRSNVVLSQAIHTAFGGVIPEIASREHLKTIVPIYEQALQEANCTLDDIELVAATHGPGLVGPLLVGLSFAKGLAFAKNIPFVPVNHMEGHLAAPLLAFPTIPASKKHLSLVVSGGHTLLVLVERFGEFTVIGTTRDDAAGEAFDKVAKLLGLGYPGGAALSKLAKDGDSKYVRFPRAMRDGSYAFSFSGLKTAVALHVQKLSPEELQARLADIAASFQEAVVEILVDKTVQAATEYGIDLVTLTGGVAANVALRERLKTNLESRRIAFFVPPASLCTDNGAMIAAAGYFRFEQFGPGELVANAIPYLKLGATA